MTNPYPSKQEQEMVAAVDAKIAELDDALELGHRLANLIMKYEGDDTEFLKDVLQNHWVNHDDVKDTDCADYVDFESFLPYSEIYRMRYGMHFPADTKGALAKIKTDLEQHFGEKFEEGTL